MKTTDMKSPDEKKYETTEEIRRLHRHVLCLEESFDRVVSPVYFWQKPISITEKLAYIQAVSNARFSLWDAVYKNFPELKGKDLSIGIWYITVL